MTTMDPLPVCEIGRDVLQRFASGEITGPVRRSVLEHLLRGCPNCRGVLRGIQEADDHFQDPSENARQVTSLLAKLHDKATRVESERTEAATLIDVFRGHPTNRQWTLIRNSARYDTWQFTARLIDLAFESMYDDARTAHELAQMALAIAQRLDSETYGERLVIDLVARAQAHIGNAQRALGQIVGAEATLRSARAEMAKGTGDPLLEAEILYFESSLLRAQRQLSPALAKARAARSIYRELADEHLEGLALLGEGSIHLVSGDTENALDCYRRALSLVQKERDPHLVLAAHHNLVFALVDAGAVDEALSELSTFRQDYQALGDQASLAKLHWTEAKIHWRCGDAENAERIFRLAIDALAALELPYEVAVASLDLALVLSTGRQFTAMRRLASDTLNIFRALGVERESIAAWLTFQRAVEAETVSNALIQRLATYFAEAGRRPGLVFDE